MIGIVLASCDSNDSPIDKTSSIKKIEEITEKETLEDEDIISFHKESDDLSWEVVYSEENEFVRIYDDRINDIFINIYGFSPFESDSYIGYDFDDNCFRVYFDYPELIEDVYILDYNVQEDEYTATLVAKGHYYFTDEYLQELEKNHLKDIFNEDLYAFKKDLKNNGISYEDIALLTYSDVK